MPIILVSSMIIINMRREVVKWERILISMGWEIMAREVVINNLEHLELQGNSIMLILMMACHPLHS